MKNQKRTNKRKHVLHQIPRSPHLCHDVLTTLHYCSFTTGTEITAEEVPRLLHRGNLKAISTVIHHLPYSETTNYFVNDFEFRHLPPSITSILLKIRKDPQHREFRVQLRNELERLMATWASIHDMDAIPVALDTVYRSTDVHENNAFGIIPFIHIDFLKNDTPSTLASFQDQWKSKLESSLRMSLTYSEYIRIPVVEMINIWMPLNDHLTASPLAFMKSCSEKYHVPYTALRKDKRRFTAVGVMRGKNDTWFWRWGAGLGTAVVMSAMRTPHTAFVIPHEERSVEPWRKSVEVRFAFIERRWVNSKLASFMV